MAATIKFGTSGWRAIIAEDFTFANVRLATEAIARHVLQQSPSPALLVGYDTRFASENFAAQVAALQALGADPAGAGDGAPGAAEAAPASPAEELNALALGWAVFRDWLRGLFSKKKA